MSYDHWESIHYNKVFTTNRDVQSFNIEHKDGKCYDFPYSYVLHSFLDSGHTIINIKHSYAEIWIYGTNLKPLYNAIRKRELEELYSGSEVQDREGKIILKVSDVHYSIEDEKKEAFPTTEESDCKL